MNTVSAPHFSIQSNPSSSPSSPPRKFFSNSYDVDRAQNNSSRMILIDYRLRSVVSELLSHPMPTIAAFTVTPSPQVGCSTRRCFEACCAAVVSCLRRPVLLSAFFGTCRGCFWTITSCCCHVLLSVGAAVCVLWGQLGEWSTVNLVLVKVHIKACRHFGYVPIYPSSNNPGILK